ncbi:MAG: hypothetical protein V4805_17165, partial [Pseudomonadota bacterium]
APWKEHLNSKLDLMKQAHQQGLESGDLIYAAVSAYGYVFHTFFTGKNIGWVMKEADKYYDAIKRIKQDRYGHVTAQLQQVMLNLQGAAADPTCLVGARYDETQMLDFHLASHDQTAAG